MRSILHILSISLFALYSLAAQAQAPPSRMLPEELEARQEEHEILNGAFPGALLIERETRQVLDERYSRPYHSAVDVYAAERGSDGKSISRYLRRFVVHAPDASALPLARRAARELLLLQSETRTRLHFDHPGQEIVEVWLTSSPGQSPDAGGEQFRNQIYLYDLYAERTPIEWARETAHEYGHYALPGVAGFTDPEEWANGVLGERLFLKWLREDLQSGRLKPEEVPFVTPEQLDEYLSRQATPLLGRIGDARNFNPAALKRTDARGMDDYIGLVLYLDSVYGSDLLRSALLDVEPKPGETLVHALDFLRGALTALGEAGTLHIMPPLPSEGTETTFLIYLPAGRWSVAASLPVRSWNLSEPVSGITVRAGRLIVRTGGWRRVTLILRSAHDAAPALTLRKP